MSKSKTIFKDAEQFEDAVLSVMKSEEMEPIHLSGVRGVAFKYKKAYTRLLKEVDAIIVEFMDTTKNEPIVRKNGLSYKTYIMELLILKSKFKALGEK